MKSLVSRNAPVAVTYSEDKTTERIRISMIYAYWPSLYMTRSTPIHLAIYKLVRYVMSGTCLTEESFLQGSPKDKTLESLDSHEQPKLSSEGQVSSKKDGKTYRAGHGWSQGLGPKISQILYDTSYSIVKSLRNYVLQAALRSLQSEGRWAKVDMRPGINSTGISLTLSSKYGNYNGSCMF